MGDRIFESLLTTEAEGPRVPNEQEELTPLL